VGAYFGGDLSTGSHIGETSHSAYETAENFFVFGNNGLKLYMLGDAGNTIDEYTCTTAYDRPSCSYVQQTSAVTGSNPLGITIHPDGSKIWHLDATGDDIYEHTLSTPFDISTITLNVQSLDISSSSTHTKGLQWNDDGSKIYFLNNNV